MHRAINVRTVKNDSLYLNADLKLKVGHAYHDQEQGQMTLAGLDVAFFALWTPKTVPPLVLKIRRDRTYLKALS